MLRANLMVPFLLACAVSSAPLGAQTPTPFPRPGSAQRPPTQPPPAAKPAAPAQPAAGPSSQGAVQPDEGMLGVPVYSGAEFITSFDAGRGQRYYLFGTNASFLDIVNYYKGVLKQKGELVYDEPPIHEFDVGRFREETMAFPPGVTVKDYTWGGREGYLNPKRGATPAFFKTIIQVVPPTP